MRSPERTNPTSDSVSRILTIFFGLVFLTGLSLLGLGLSRLRLPYEEGRYFDPATATVYHLQAAEFYVSMGALTGAMGAGFLAYRFRRRRTGQF